MSAFKTQRTVEYAQTDMAGIVHYSEFFRYMESAEHEFFRSVGLSVHPQNDPDAPSWPRVSCQFDYQQPLRFEDVFDIHLTLTKLGKRSATFHARLFRDGSPIAEGSSTCVCCQVKDGQLTPQAIPESLREKIIPLLETEETRS